MKFNNEKEVEYFYWSALEKIGRQMDKGFTMTAANKTDGYFSTGNIKAICEIKYGFDFSNSSDVARVIIQALYYIKSRQKRGLESPSSIFVGDDDQYFIVSVKQFADILDGTYSNEMDPKWEISPSSAYKQNHKLFQQLFVRQIPLMVKKLEDTFDTEFVRNRLIALASNENIKTKLNSESIKKPFHFFTQSVLLAGENLKDHVKIKLFFAVITGSEDAIYLRGKIKFEGKDYPIHDGYYAGFVNIYQTKYKTSERESFVASMDNLIKEEARRFHGAYFTPKFMVDYSHEVISEQLGDNWRDEYVVWDPAAGTLNLTRDYQFKELYCSTLFQEELDLASDYNPEAIKFQFDFLNDEFKPIKSGGKVHDNLYSAILDEKKKVMILMNPPYGTAASGIGVSSKGGAASSNPINAIMQDNNFAQAAQDLYTIFIFNSIIILTQEGKINLNRTISQFTKTGFLSTGGMINFSQYMKERFTMKKGFAFDSKYFEGAAGGWPVIFSIWESAKIPGETGKEVIVDFVKLSDENKVEQETKKKFYIIEKNENATEWVKEKNKGKILDKNQITLSMPCTVKPLEGKNGKVFKNNSIGYFLCNSNTLKKAPTDTAIFSYSYSSGHGSAIDSDNIFRVTTLFVARKTPLTIYNYNDEFSKPNEENSKFEEFKNNSVVYSLFNTSSYQSSLRKIGYDSTGNPISYPTSVNKGNINVYNEWFFLSHKEITELADEHFSELYQDTKGQKDRHIQLELEKLIAANKLSPEALAVLEAGRKLVRDTFPIREKIHAQFPEYHLNAWDAGYWQIRTALERAGMESYLVDMKAKYKLLEDKMRPLVYELGFLKSQQ
jgi:hypothetical protein